MTYIAPLAIIWILGASLTLAYVIGQKIARDERAAQEEIDEAFDLELRRAKVQVVPGEGNRWVG